MPEDFEPDVVGPDEGEPSPEPEPDDDFPTPGEGEPEPEPDSEPEPSDEPDDDEPAEPSSAKGRSAKLDKLLAKYGGDPDKMVDAYFEQANSMSELTGTVKQLIERLNQQPADPEAEARFIAEDPDVKEISGELAALKADIDQSNQYEKQLVGDYGKLDKEIQALQAKLDAADPTDPAVFKLQRDLDSKERARDKIERDYKDNRRDRARAENQARGLVRQYRTAEANAKAKRAQAENQKWALQAAEKATRAEFNTASRDAAKRIGISPDSKHYAVLHQSVRDRLVTHLNSLGPDAEAVDITEAVNLLFDEYAESFDLKKTFQQTSKDKAKTTTTQAGATPKGKVELPKDFKPPKGIPLTDPTGRYASAAYWRARAKRIARS